MKKYKGHTWKYWKARWLKALRGGEYKQGREYLCTIGEDGVAYYCCLGVLAEILGTKHAPIDNAASGIENVVKYKFGKLENSQMPPIQFWTAVGAPFVEVDRRGRVDGQDAKHFAPYLAEKNDEDWTFKKIANWIEENL